MPCLPWLSGHSLEHLGSRQRHRLTRRKTHGLLPRPRRPGLPSPPVPCGSFHCRQALGPSTVELGNGSSARVTITFESQISIAALVHLNVLVIRHGVQQPQNVLARLRVEAVEQRGVCSTFFPLQLQLRIVHDQVSIVSDAQFLTDLQNDLRSCAWCCHEPSSFGPFLFLPSSQSRQPPSTLMRHCPEKAYNS